MRFETLEARTIWISPTMRNLSRPEFHWRRWERRLRQSEIGLEVFGPTVAGAKTSADVQFDFAGGFPATGNGVNFGIVRLQTASLRFDWEHTSVVAGQDSLFISPLSPTSFASLATPAFAYTGNLWGWTPQIRVEHRFALSDQQTLTMQAGVLDNLDWEPPYNCFYRTVQAGELSGQPAYAFRTAWSRPVREHPTDLWSRRILWSPELDLGPIRRRMGRNGRLAGPCRATTHLVRRVLSGQRNWRTRRWDWLLDLVWSRSKESLRAHSRADVAGGWTQLKFQLTPKLEFNGAIAQDNAFAGDARGFATDTNNFGPILGRNRGALANVVFRPRSDLILSAEVRRLRTFPVYSSSSFANQINLAMGILF